MRAGSLRGRFPQYELLDVGGQQPWLLFGGVQVNSLDPVRAMIYGLDACAGDPATGGAATLLPVRDDETRLYDRATQGDEHALDQLLQHYLPQLHAFVHARLGAELRARESSLDVVQSVCRELLAERDRFDFRGEERFRGWLFTAALNKVRERHRRLHSQKRDVGREAPIDDAGSFAGIVHLLTPSQDAIGNETAAALRDALAALSEELREVISLVRLARLPHRVVAEVMDRSEEAARQLLARAMVQLVLGLRRRGVDVDRWNLR